MQWRIPWIKINISLPVMRVFMKFCHVLSTLVRTLPNTAVLFFTQKPLSTVFVGKEENTACFSPFFNCAEA